MMLASIPEAMLIKSYRTGLEFQSEWKIVDPLIWTANLTLSLNKNPDLYRTYR